MPCKQREAEDWEAQQSGPETHTQIRHQLRPLPAIRPSLRIIAASAEQTIWAAVLEDNGIPFDRRSVYQIPHVADEFEHGRRGLARAQDDKFPLQILKQVALKGVAAVRS